MNEELKELKRREDAAERALREAREAVEKAENAERSRRLDGLKGLACRAHDVLCPYEHCESCGWLYEVHETTGHNWNGSSHARWLKHIDSLVNPGRYDNNEPVSVEVIDRLLDAVKDIKSIQRGALWLITSRLIPR